MNSEIIDGRLIITENAKPVESYVFGSSLNNLDTRRHASANASWCIATVPMLMSRLIKAGYSFEFKTKGESIILNPLKLEHMTMCSSYRILNTHGLTIDRWHGGIMSFNREYGGTVLLNLHDLVSIKASRITGIDELDSEWLVPVITIVPGETSPIGDKGFWTITASVSDHRDLYEVHGRYNDLSNDFKGSFGTETLFRKRTHCPRIGIDDNVIVQSLEQLYDLFVAHRIIASANDSTIRKAIKEIKQGNRIIVSFKHDRFDYVEYDFVASMFQNK